MDAIPEIKYARSGDVYIAYQSWGSGPHVLGVPPFVQNIEALWSDPSGKYPRFLREIGGFATVTHFDKRGTGLSDRVSRDYGIEARMDDLRAVLDDAGIERAFIAGMSEGGPMAMLFAATYPDRVRGLILAGSTARFLRDDGYHGVSPGRIRRFGDELAAHWGTLESPMVQMFTPSLAGDPAYRRWFASYERACASPGAVRDIIGFIAEVDVRDVLPAITCPTLVLHRTNERMVPVEQGRFLAEHIAGAQLVELDGEDHTPWTGDVSVVIAEIEQFVTGHRSAHVDAERFLATVVFTDIVGSTERATQLGDRPWRELLDRHDRAVRDQLARHGGREVVTTGDGFLAVFDSPSRAVRAASEIVNAVRALGLEVRAGVHTGEVERRGDNVAGLAVHVGARVGALAAASEVLVSSTVRDLVLGSEFRFQDRGRQRLRGVAGEWQLLALQPAR